MRMYLMLLLCLIACKNKETQKTSCDRSFFEAITKDENSLIVFNASVDGQNEKVCLSNRSLKWRLKNKYGVDGNAYTELVREIVTGKKVLNLTMADIGNNYIVTMDEEINEVYRKGGLDSLKETYFRENGVQKEMPIENKKYLASLFFENCIISWIDDYTGYLILKESS